MFSELLVSMKDANANKKSFKTLRVNYWVDSEIISFFSAMKNYAAQELAYLVCPKVWFLLTWFQVNFSICTTFHGAISISFGN